MTVAVAKVALLKWRKKTRFLQLKCSKGKITKTERYFKKALAWFVMMTVMRSSSLLSLTAAIPDSCKSKFLPFGAAVLKLGELGVSTQCILLTLCGSSTALLPGPLTTTEVTQKSGWVCLDRGTHGSSWHFHISGFKSILNVKSAQFSVTKEIIDTSHSDKLNSHSCYLLLPQFTKWL